MRSKGKWTYRSVGSRMSGGVSQDTNFVIEVLGEQTFLGVALASTQARWPNDDFTNRDGSPDNIAIDENNRKRPLQEVKDNFEHIVKCVNSHEKLVDAAWSAFALLKDFPEDSNAHKVATRAKQALIDAGEKHE